MPMGGNLESDDSGKSDPVTAAAAASISLNPSSKPASKSATQHSTATTATYGKTVSMSGSNLTQLNTVTNTVGGYSVVPSSASGKTIVVVPVTSNANNAAASGDSAAQPVLKKMKITTNN